MGNMPSVGRRLVAGVLGFCVCLEAASSLNAAGVPPPTGEDYAVYAVILSGIVSPERVAVISEDTSDAVLDLSDAGRSFDPEGLRRAFAEQACCAGIVNPRPLLLDERLLASFVGVRGQHVRLDWRQLKIPATDVSPSLELTPAELPTDPDLSRWWRRRRAGNAKLHVTVSRVGYSRDSHRALVSVDYQCRSDCVGGEYFLLVKEHGAWRIAARVFQWWG